MCIRDRAICPQAVQQELYSDTERLRAKKEPDREGDRDAPPNRQERQHDHDEDDHRQHHEEGCRRPQRGVCNDA